MATSFTFLTRTQFKFRTEAAKFDAILKAIAGAKVSINAYNIKQRKNHPRVLLVVGLPGNVDEDAKWNKRVKLILREYEICYTYKEVVQVIGIPSGVSGVISRIYNALYREVQIYNIYLAEDTHRIIDSDNNRRVIRILSQL